MIDEWSQLQFEPIKMTPSEDCPYLYLTVDHVIFGKKCLEALCYSPYVQMCINPKERILAIKRCLEEDYMTMRFYTDAKGYVENKRIVLNATLSRLIACYDPQKRYVVPGKYDRENEVLFFYIKEAIEVNSYFEKVRVAANLIEKMDSELSEISKGQDNELIISEDECDSIKEYTEEKSSIRGRKRKPLTISIYIDNEFAGSFTYSRTIQIGKCEKIELKADKQVIWSNYETLNEAFVGKNSISFKASHNIKIEYISKNSKTLDGVPEKGIIKIYVKEVKD